MKEAKPAFIYIQKGGSSSELYIHSRETLKEAEAGRRSCAEGAYETSRVMIVPPNLAALGEVFYEMVEEILDASTDLECP